jgi:hypothetical protein
MLFIFVLMFIVRFPSRNLRDGLHSTILAVLDVDEPQDGLRVRSTMSESTGWQLFAHKLLLLFIIIH